MPTMNLVPATVSDDRRLAEKHLPRFLFDYVDGGAYDEVTLARNTADFQNITPKQRVMVDVSDIKTNTKLCGLDIDQPVALAPIGMGGMLARRSELQAKRAADAANVPFTLSTVGICSLEEVAQVSDRPFWFQLYMLRDRDIVKEILDRAWAVGVRTLVFTVDLAVVGERYRDTRNGIAGGANAWGRLRAGLLSYLSHPKWLVDVGLRGKPHTFGNLMKYVPNATSPTDFRAWVGSQFDASVTWKDIAWLRDIWKGHLMIKGVLSAHDATEAVTAGADSVVVSNHGGRQLDGVASSITVLPKVVEAVGGRCEILVDSGVRNGLDVMRATALGANGVMIGRAWAYAMAANGQKGVETRLARMKQELTTSMALSGVTRINDLSPDLLTLN